MAFLLLLMTAHKQGIGFMTEEDNFSHVTEVPDTQAVFCIIDVYDGSSWKLP